ncbi:MAG: S8 family peptidase [Oligoflexia bacterium]|nr:S8 family peptidase [Oligoflexia bacterium]
MRIITSFILILALAGCGSSGDDQNVCATSSSQDPFLSRGKIQISSVGLNLSQGHLGVVNGPTSDSLNKILDQGTELVAVIKDQCLASGKILEGVQVDSADLQLTSSGVKSLQWILPRAMSVGEIQNLVEKDACLVGIADSVVQYPSELSPQAVDPLINQQRHLDAIGANQAYQTFYNAQGIKKDVVIAIIDTGVDILHEDLRGNLWVNKREIPGNRIDDDKNGYVDDVHGYNFVNRTGNPGPVGNWKAVHHGTHVAGLAAAAMGNNSGGIGVMGRFGKIMALNVFGNVSGASSSKIDNAIRYAADNGAEVINMSLGGPGKASSTESAVSYAISKGVTVVVAAGNDNQQLTATNFQTPASYGAVFSGMITIGATDAKKGSRSYFSNYSTQYVELGAPGSDSEAGGLMSTMPGSRYARLQGTSMASPVAAGSAALAIGLLKSRGWKATPKSIEYLLANSGTTDSKLTSFFKSGKHLNVKTLADTIVAKFPMNASGAMADVQGALCLVPEM